MALRKEFAQVKDYFSLDRRDPFESLEESLPESSLEEEARAIVDRPSADAMEFAKLYHKHIPQMQTNSGRLKLAYSLMRPPIDADNIRERQAAVEELRDNNQLRKTVRDVVSTAANNEIPASRLLRRDGFGHLLHRDLGETRQLVRDTVGAVKHQPRPDSQLLESLLINQIRDASDTDLYRYSNEIIYRQGGLAPLHKGQLEKGLLGRPSPSALPEPTQTFRPGAAIASSAIYAMAAGSGFLTANYFHSLSPESAFLGLPILMALPAVFAGVGSVKGHIHHRMTITPTMERFRKDTDAQGLYEAIGTLDELVTLADLADKVEDHGYAVTSPEITETYEHSVRFKDLVNIQQGLEGNYTPHDRIDIGAELGTPTFITGPNSYGKTSAVKAIAQAQTLAQMGMPIPAQEASIVPADRVMYHVGKNDTQADEEGGFGSQLQRTKTILQKATPRSLVVVDDLIAGTNPEAELRHTLNSYFALAQTGADSIIVAHHHDAVAEFYDSTGRGRCLYAEGDQDYNPTRQFREGLSKVSNADLVASRVGMDKEGIIRTLNAAGHNVTDLYSLD